MSVLWGKIRSQRTQRQSTSEPHYSGHGNPRSKTCSARTITPVQCRFYYWAKVKFGYLGLIQPSTPLARVNACPNCGSLCTPIITPLVGRASFPRPHLIQHQRGGICTDRRNHFYQCATDRCAIFQAYSYAPNLSCVQKPGPNEFQHHRITQRVRSIFPPSQTTRSAHVAPGYLPQITTAFPPIHQL
ncbi:MAG: hypothetical protein CM1200mP41_01800 [Gammaproteobacteria bacterium]|nr:MAG: hypothetical protein CM1200mP41_01800 [Gammaproteobacteria bacterium]